MHSAQACIIKPPCGLTSWFLPCRAVLYNFPLHSELAQSSKIDLASANKPGTAGAESPAAAAGPAPALTQLCLLVDVTASKLKRVGRYNLGRVVGRGSFGVVRLGQNTQTGAGHIASCLHDSFPRSMHCHAALRLLDCCT